MENYSEAIEICEEAISKFPEDTSLLHLKGNTLIKLGKKEEACIQYELAIELGDENAQKSIDKYCKK